MVVFLRGAIGDDLAQFHAVNSILVADSHAGEIQLEIYLIFLSARIVTTKTYHSGVSDVEICWECVSVIPQIHDISIDGPITLIDNEEKDRGTEMTERENQ